MGDDIIPAKRTVTEITPKTFKDILEKYHSTVPEKVKDLEEERLHRIPEALAKRKKDGSDAYLTWGEVVKLVDWKLYVADFISSHLPLKVTGIA